MDEHASSQEFFAENYDSERSGQMLVASKERKELKNSLELSFDDEYIMEIVSKWKGAWKILEPEFSKLSSFDKNSPEYVAAKADFFGIAKDELESRIKNRHEQLRVLKIFKKTESSKYKAVEDDISALEECKGNFVRMKEAYKKFAGDKVKIEGSLLGRITRGEIRIPEDFPYVMFMNKNTEKQYGLLYKYDGGKLQLKSCNLVSTGDQFRWNETENYDHSTPRTTFYVGTITGLNSPSLDPENANLYGKEAVKKDQKPYKMYRLYWKEGGQYIYTPYLMHGTNEEPLLGETASHGCLRIPRLMNLQIMRVYDKWFKQHGTSDFLDMEDDKVHTPSVKMPIYVDSI